jgi:Type ISP C-terminal specificity domain
VEKPALTKAPSAHPINGENVVTKPHYENGCVYINARQYFANVPESVWAFCIGGYQPAQKWLRDSKERVLSFEDIVHYQYTGFNMGFSFVGTLSGSWLADNSKAMVPQCAPYPISYVNQPS